MRFYLDGGGVLWYNLEKRMVDFMSKYTGYTDRQNKATQKYQKENLEQVRFWVPIGKKDEYKAFAESRGMSLTALIVELLEKEMRK